MFIVNFYNKTDFWDAIFSIVRNAKTLFRRRKIHIGLPINHLIANSKADLIRTLQLYPTALKIEDPDVYWDERSGTLIVLTTPEWQQYLTGKTDSPLYSKDALLNILGVK